MAELISYYIILPLEFPIKLSTSSTVLATPLQGGLLVAISMIIHPKLQISTDSSRFFDFWTISGAIQYGHSEDVIIF